MRIARESLEKQMAGEALSHQAILSSMGDGVMVVNPDRTIRLVNHAFVHGFDLKRTPIGQTVLQALRDAHIEELISDTLAAGESRSRQISIRLAPPGAERHFAASAVPARDDRGNVNGVIVVFHDISRLRQLEEIRRHFVANVSHELRTPLSIFQGYLENLIDDPGMPRKEVAGILEIMKKHSGRLNALVDDLLVLARLESRREELDPAPIDLEPFLRQLMKDWNRRIEKKKIAVSLEVEPGLPLLSADENRMEQVFNNLFDNALKYTAPEGQIYITAGRHQDLIRVDVRDSGIGIPPADLPHIFERFYRADKARSRELGGTGLGLSIVKHIVALHRGSVTARSVVGKGTTISVALPLNGNIPADSNGNATAN